MARARWWVTFCLFGMVVTGPVNWLGFLLRTTNNTLSWLALGGGQQVSALSKVYMVFISLSASTAGPMSIVIIGLVAIIDATLIGLCARSTISASSSAEADGLSMSLGLAAELLVSPVAWHHELVLLIPLYFFSAAIIASMLLNSTRVDRQFYAGAAITALGLLAAVVLYFTRITRGMQAHFFVLLASCAGASFCSLRDVVGFPMRRGVNSLRSWSNPG
jgi:hypothetical protein